MERMLDVAAFGCVVKWKMVGPWIWLVDRYFWMLAEHRGEDREVKEDCCISAANANGNRNKESPKWPQTEQSHIIRYESHWSVYIQTCNLPSQAKQLQKYQEIANYQQNSLLLWHVSWEITCLGHICCGQFWWISSSLFSLILFPIRVHSASSQTLVMMQMQSAGINMLFSIMALGEE